jgi:hypothetical protein
MMGFIDDNEISVRECGSSSKCLHACNVSRPTDAISSDEYTVWFGMKREADLFDEFMAMAENEDAPLLCKYPPCQLGEYQSFAGTRWRNVEHAPCTLLEFAAYSCDIPLLIISQNVA